MQHWPTLEPQRQPSKSVDVSSLAVDELAQRLFPSGRERYQSSIALDGGTRDEMRTIIEIAAIDHKKLSVAQRAHTGESSETRKVRLTASRTSHSNRAPQMAASSPNKSPGLYLSTGPSSVETQ